MAEEQQIEGLPEGATLRPVQPQPAASDASQVEGLPEGATLRPVTPLQRSSPSTPEVSPKAPYAGVKAPAAKPQALPQKDALTQADENGGLPDSDALAVKAVRGVRGLYHGAMGDEETAASKGQTTTASPEAASLGFTPEHIGYKAGEMLHGVGKFGKEAVQDIGTTPVVIPDKGDKASFADPKAHTLVAKYVTAPSMAERQASQDEMQKYFETKGPAAAGHAISAFLHGTLGEYVPVVGPLAMSLEDQAQKGDLGGALAQLASLYAVEKGTGAVKEGIKDRINAKVSELTKTPEVKQAEANVEATREPLEIAQQKHDAAMAEHNKYSASHAQGIDSPKPVKAALEKAQAELDEAQAHHDLAKEHLEKNKAAQPTIPQQVGGAVGRAVGKVLPTPAPMPEVPTENVEAAPVLTKLGEKVPAEPALAPINVKTPGQVQPETFPQEPKPAPRPSYGRITLPNEQGTMGTPKLLTEGTPEGPQIPKGGLPKINLLEEKPAVATKPTTDEAALRALSTNGKGEVVETPEKKIGRLLQEALKPEAKKEAPTPEAKAPEAPTEKRGGERRVAEETLPEGQEERRQNERRVLQGMNERAFTEGHTGQGGEKPIDTDAYAKAMEQARKELGPDASVKDVMKRRDEIVNPEAKGKTGDVGTQSRETNPEPTRAEAKVKPVLPKEEPTGYTAKKEEVVPAGAEGREPVKSAAEYHPAVEQKINELSDDNLKKLAKAHGLNPDEYDFKARDERRHRTERDQLAKDITEQIGEDEKINLGRAAESAEKEPGFANRDQSAKARAERAAKLFPRLRGPVDEYGNPKVSGGAPDTVGTKEAADKDTEHFANAKKELGPNASISEVAKRAQELKDAAKGTSFSQQRKADEAAYKKADLKRVVSDYNNKEGLGPVKDNKLEVDPRSKEIARAYDDMKHDPSNPEVKKSYAALIDDAKKQWDALKKAGIKLEPQDEDPYKSYDEMKKDFDDNKRLKVFRGGNPLPEDHPLAQVDPKTGETYNVMFRGVHDAIGHLLHNNDFSEKGEENAYDTHRQTMSKEAIPAMTTETKGQVSAFFNGGNEFPDQKAGLLPDKFTGFNAKGSPVDEFGNPTVSGGAPEKKLPTGDALIKKYGESNGDPKDLTFILKDGRGVANTGIEHDHMLGGRTDEKVPPRERFIAEGNIRIRPRQGAGGREVAMSIPESGVTSEQLKYIQKMSPQLRSGAVMIEVGKPGGAYKAIPYGEASPEQLETVIRGLGPVLNDKGSPIDWNGNPTVSGGSPSAGTSTAKVGKLPKLAEEHLTEEEKAGVTKTEAGRKSFVDNLKKLPSVQEFMDIAKAGEGGRKWYQRSSAAFDALTEEAPKYFKDGDRQKFTDFLAALSPQQSVKMNLGEALNAWTRYVDEGRPTGESLKKMLRDELTLSGAKIPNATKALAGEPLWPDLSKNSNFKVPSFAKNLSGYLNHVTNDGWQALFGGLDAKDIATAKSYHPLAVVTREAAKALGWEPAEAQAAIWAFTKTFTEKGETEPADIRRRSEDFADILAMDPEIRQQLKQLGVNHEQLDAKLRAIGKKPPITSGASSSSEGSIRKLAARIEGARGKGTIPPPKSGNLNFNDEDEETRFEPKDFTNEEPSLEKLGKKKSPYGNLR